MSFRVWVYRPEWRLVRSSADIFKSRRFRERLERPTKTSLLGLLFPLSRVPPPPGHATVSRRCSIGGSLSLSPLTEISTTLRTQQPTSFFLLHHLQGGAVCFSAGFLTCFLFRLPFVRQTSFGRGSWLSSLKEPLPRERSCLQVRVRTRKLAFVGQGAVAPRTIGVSQCGFGRQNAVQFS